MPTRPRHAAGLALVVGALLASVAWAGPVGAQAAVGDADDQPAAPAVVAEDEAELEAAVLAAEDRRLTEVRTITSLARWQGKNWKTPYRLGGTTGYTLVLTPRSEPYTIEDLLALAPQTFLRMTDGSFLLSEHIVVTPRATLRLSAPNGLVLRMASSHNGFATIVSMGGRVEVLGEEGAPVEVTSWDPGAGVPDAETADGRSYLRAIGGQFEADHVRLSHLGFWSGRTGGLALTGTDRPNTGAIESGADEPADPGAPVSLLEGVTWQPAGPLEPGQTNPQIDYTVPAFDYVSSQLRHLDVEGNAFGLFVSGANGIQVSDSSFVGNSLGGVVLHRYVTNGVISRTTSNDNGGDGFTRDRATTGITITESIAEENAESGFRLAGRPLAEGPSAVGASLRSYGGNTVSGSTAANNGRYGIELLGGVNISVSGNVVRDHDMGVVVSGPASRVAITGNTVEGSDRHGVALVDGVTQSTVTGNVVDGSSTGVYVRDSSADVKGNTVQSARSHGVSLVGDVDGSSVSFNVLAGRGQSALDTMRSHGGVSRSTNNLDGWSDTSPWYLWFKKLLQPMSALWTLLAILLVTSAIRSRRRNGLIEHPYAHQMAHQGILPMPQPITIDLTDGRRAMAAE